MYTPQTTHELQRDLCHAVATGNTEEAQRLSVEALDRSAFYSKTPAYYLAYHPVAQAQQRRLRYAKS